MMRVWYVHGAEAAAPLVDSDLREATIAVLRERGWSGLTLERVAEVAGRARSTLWRQGLTRRVARPGARRRAGRRLPARRCIPILTTRRDGPRAARARPRRALRAHRPPPAADARERRGVPPAAASRPAARLPAAVHHVPARRRRGWVARPGRGRWSRRPTRCSTRSRGRTSTCAAGTTGPPTAPRAVVVGLVLERHPTERTKGDAMSLPYVGAARSAASLASVRSPEPPRRGEPGGPPCGICAGADDSRRLVGRQLDAASARRRQPARRGLAREPRARRLVHRPARAARGGLRPRRRAGRARDPLARRRRPRPPLPVGRRRRALPRLDAPAPARHDRRRTG